MVSTRGVKSEFSENERVLCYEPDPTKSKVLYDAKIIEVKAKISEETGKKEIRYFVHFNGWSASWDREVDDSFILKDTPENRHYQAELNEEADLTDRDHKRKKKSLNLDARVRHASKRHRSGSESSNSVKCGSTRSSCAESVEVTRRTERAVSEADSSATIRCSKAPGTRGTRGAPRGKAAAAVSADADSDEEDCSPVKIQLEIPPELREKLYSEWFLLNDDKMLVRLPSHPNVVQVLERFVRYYVERIIEALKVGFLNGSNSTFLAWNFDLARSNPHLYMHKMINLCKEVAEGIRIMFDFLLPVRLLYSFERPQYNKFLDSPELLCQSPPSGRSRRGSHAGSSGPMSPGSGRRERASDRSGSAGLMSPRSLRSVQPKEGSPRDETPDTPETPTRRQLRTSTTAARQTPPNTQVKKEKDDMSDRQSTTDSDIIINTPLRRPALRSTTSGSRAVTNWSQDGSKGGSSYADSDEPKILTRNTSSRNLVAAMTDAEGEAILRTLLSWQLYPEKEYSREVPPSILYGAQHLLRLFDIVPDILSSVAIPKVKREYTIDMYGEILTFMSETSEELFAESHYTESSNA